MLATHPFLQPSGEPYAPDERFAIQRAVEILGFGHVNDCAWEATRTTTRSLHAIREFAFAMEGEAQFLLHQQQLAREAAAEAQRQRIRRRNAAATALLLD